MGNEKHRGHLFHENDLNSTFTPPIYLATAEWLQKKTGVPADLTRGIFAGKVLNKHEPITPYTGTITYLEDSHQSTDTRAFYKTLLHKERCVIDGCRTPIEGFGMGQFANDARGRDTPNSKFIVLDSYNPNNTIKNRDMGIYLEATRRIEIGEEITVSYGSGYFQAYDLNITAEIHSKRTNPNKRPRHPHSETGDVTTKEPKAKRPKNQPDSAHNKPVCNKRTLMTITNTTEEEHEHQHPLKRSRPHHPPHTTQPVSQEKYIHTQIPGQKQAPKQLSSIATQQHNHTTSHTTSTQHNTQTYTQTHTQTPHQHHTPPTPTQAHDMDRTTDIHASRDKRKEGKDEGDNTDYDTRTETDADHEPQHKGIHHAHEGAMEPRHYIAPQQPQGPQHQGSPQQSLIRHVLAKQPPWPAQPRRTTEPRRLQKHLNGPETPTQDSHRTTNTTHTQQQPPTNTPTHNTPTPHPNTAANTGGRANNGTTPTTANAPDATDVVMSCHKIYGTAVEDHPASPAEQHKAYGRASASAKAHPAKCPTQPSPTPREEELEVEDRIAQQGAIPVKWQQMHEPAGNKAAMICSPKYMSQPPKVHQDAEGLTVPPIYREHQKSRIPDPPNLQEIGKEPAPPRSDMSTRKRLRGEPETCHTCRCHMTSSYYSYDHLRRNTTTSGCPTCKRRHTPG
jgi:hypothetical protein